MHTCMDGYYIQDEFMSKTKLASLARVMKGALSVSKSKTGQTITRDNKLERQRLGAKLSQFSRELKFSCLENEHKKTLFYRKYKRSINVSTSYPPGVNYLLCKFNVLKQSVKDKTVTMELLPHSKYGGKLTQADDITGESQSSITTKHRIVITEPDEASHAEEDLPYYEDEISDINTNLLTKPERDLIREAKLEKRKKRHPRTIHPEARDSKGLIWCETTFDMTGIKDMLELQREKQEQLAIRIKLERLNTQKDIRQRLADDPYRSEVDRIGRLAASPSASNIKNSIAFKISKRRRDIPKTCARFISHGNVVDTKPVGIVKAKTRPEVSNDVGNRKPITPPVEGSTTTALANSNTTELHNVGAKTQDKVSENPQGFIN